MGTCDPGMPGPVLFLFLVLLPFLMCKGSLLYRRPGYRDSYHLGLSWGSLRSHLSQDQGRLYQRRSPGTWQHDKGTGNKNACHSSYDLYFVLDRSGSVDNNWMHVYNFAEGVVRKFENPEIRMSFITYSSQSVVRLKLTSDRKQIEEGLNRLRSVVPSGATNMHEGLKKAVEQIAQVNAGGEKRPSIIIAQTDGALLSDAFQASKAQAEKARNLGATVFGVGVLGYIKEQLVEIADSEDHVLAANNGFKALPKIADALTSKACIEVTSAKASRTCLKENYELVISGKGFHNTKNKDKVICRFKFSKDKFFDTNATSVEDTTIKCPGVTVEKPDQEVFIGLSLDNGISFSKENISITSKDCVEKQAQPPNAPPPNPPPEAEPEPSPETPPAQNPSPSPPTQFTTVINPLCFLALIPALLMFPLLFCCRRCYKKSFKETPPVQQPEKEPETCYIQTCPTMIVPCCECQVCAIRRMEGKQDTPCNLVPNCNQLPLMCCQPRRKRRCFNFALMKYYLGQLPCSPKTCLGPSQECYSRNRFCSSCHQPPFIFSQPPYRMLPLIPPAARALCRTTLSLPPP